MNYKRPVAVISFFTAVLVALKLLGQLDWSWWGVLAPLWAPPGIILLAVIVILLLFDIDE